jgi:acyl-CoA dehydrogenase
VLGRQILKRTEPAPGRFPSEHLPPILDAAWEKYGAYLGERPED